MTTSKRTSKPHNKEAVRKQYENYPFPQRDPADESHKLYVTGLDSLGKINHYCFSGRQNFSKNFRVLVAGGGTGDAAVYVAHQCRGRNAEIVYLDTSRASMAIAQKRAAIRRLDNIKWHLGSLLDLNSKQFGKFDYINCAGVLHHLADPAAGLRALAKVLKDDGAMGLMVYGLWGRQDVYLTQQLMRLINRGELDLTKQISNARKVLASLPASNWLLRARSREQLLRQFERDDPDIVDTFLHRQDQAFSVRAVYDMLDGAGLKLIAFTNFHMAGNIGTRLEYDPVLYVSDAGLLARICAMPLPTRQEVAELMSGAISLHAFYAASSQDRIASFEDASNVPFFVTGAGREACRALNSRPREKISIELRPGITLTFDPGAQAREIVGEVDGTRTIGEIITRLNAHRGHAASVAAGQRIYLEERTVKDLNVMNALDWIALRHQSVAPFELVM